MVREIVRLAVQDGHEDAFADDFAKAKPLFRAAQGCGSVELLRCIERPSEFWLIIDWETVEHHTVEFAQSPAGAQLGALIGPHLAAAPALAHARRVFGIAV